MRISIKAKSKKYDEYAKLIEKVLNRNKEFNFTAEIVSDISAKLVTWKMLLGKEAVQEVIKTYLES